MFERRLVISAKCGDMISGHVYDETTGERSPKFEGDVPSCVGSGDYIQLSIDLETGQIMDWPGKEAVLRQLAPEDEYEE